MRNFMPSIGRLVRYREPAGGGADGTVVRVDSGVVEGSESVNRRRRRARLPRHGAKNGCHQCNAIKPGSHARMRRNARHHDRGFIGSMIRSLGTLKPFSLSSYCVRPGNQLAGYRREKPISVTRHFGASAWYKHAL